GMSGTVGLISGTLQLTRSLALVGPANVVTLTAAAGPAVTLGASGPVTFTGLNALNGDPAILVTGGGAHVISGTNFLGVGVGLSNTTGLTVAATLNYWGASTGPADPANPDGAGRSVSGAVAFSPWCTQPAPTCAPLGFLPPRLRFVPL